MKTTSKIWPIECNTLSISKMQSNGDADLTWLVLKAEQGGYLGGFSIQFKHISFNLTWLLQSISQSRFYVKLVANVSKRYML